MKKKFLVMTTAIFLLVLSGCSKESEREITDRSGEKVKIPTEIKTIISTAPSNTEIISDLGLSDKLVAVDKFSTDVKGISSNLPQIDFSNPDAEAIISLKPDVIIASSHNKTVTGEDPFKLISEAGIPVIYVPVSSSIENIYKDIEFLSNVLGEKSKGESIVGDMKSQIEEIKSIGKTIKDKKSVYFEISPAPDMSSFGKGTFLNEMIEIIGAKNIFANENSWIMPSSEAVLDKNPDVILTNVNYIDNPVGEIKNRDGFENINAVKENQIYQIDTNSSSRPSNHILLALKQMAKAVYPKEYEKQK